MVRKEKSGDCTPWVVVKCWATWTFTSGSSAIAPASKIVPEVIEERTQNTEASQFPWEPVTIELLGTSHNHSRYVRISCVSGEMKGEGSRALCYWRNRSLLVARATREEALSWIESREQYFAQICRQDKGSHWSLPARTSTQVHSVVLCWVGWTQLADRQLILSWFRLSAPTNSSGTSWDWGLLESSLLNNLSPCTRGCAFETH